MSLSVKLQHINWRPATKIAGIDSRFVTLLKKAAKEGFQ